MRMNVVIISHNYKRFVGQAIQSVLDQSRPADKVIVIDDGSTDGSRELIKAFGSAVMLLAQANKGHVAAFCAGFSACEADAITFLDADDVLYPSCLARVEKAWTSNDIAKVQYRLDTIDENNTDQRMPFPFFPAGTSPITIRDQAFRHGIYPWTVSSGNAYANAYLKQVLPIDSSRFPRSPDGYVNKLAPLYGDVVSLDEILGAYRVHGSNTWAQGHGALNSKTINQTVRLDLELDEEFRARAKQLGRPIAERLDLDTPQHLEYRILGLKLDPGQNPVRSDSLGGLLMKAIGGLARQESLTLSGRAAWAIWFTFFVALPRKWAEKAYITFRSQTGRAGLARLTIEITRRRRRAAPTKPAVVTPL